MNNMKKTTVTMSEEEISKMKGIDWAAYYSTQQNRDAVQIRTCPKCKVMIFPQPGETEFICKRCGERIAL